jgi:hypothetical protein
VRCVILARGHRRKRVFCSGVTTADADEIGWLWLWLWPGLAENESFISECSAGRPAGRSVGRASAVSCCSGHDVIRLT